MNTTVKVLVFGVASGLIWSLAPIILGDGFTSARETTKVLVSGVSSGVLVSLALRTPLSKSGRLGAFIAGLLSLPLGAFLFGFLSSVVEMFTAGTFDLHPFLSGFYYAAMSVISFFALYFFPLAVLTTFVLRAVILSGRKHDNAAQC